MVATKLISGGEMDAENDSNHLLSVSGQEIEVQEDGNVKEGSLFYRQDKHCPSGCMNFVSPTLLQKIGELAGIAVGSMVTISSIFAGPISGGSMNPARSLGPAIVSNNYTAIWVYFLGPIFGTIMGAWSYHIIRFTNKPLQAISLRHSSSFSVIKCDGSKSVIRNDFI